MTREKLHHGNIDFIHSMRKQQSSDYFLLTLSINPTISTLLYRMLVIFEFNHLASWLVTLSKRSHYQDSKKNLSRKLWQSLNCSNACTKQMVLTLFLRIRSIKPQYEVHFLPLVRLLRSSATMKKIINL